MKTKVLLALLILVTTLSAAARVEAQKPAGSGRLVAVTFDDLPLVSLQRDVTSQTLVTRKLLRAITANRVPAIGFVNESQLLSASRTDERRVALLEMWLDDQACWNHRVQPAKLALC